MIAFHENYKIFLENFEELINLKLNNSKLRIFNTKSFKKNFNDVIIFLCDSAQIQNVKSSHESHKRNNKAYAKFMATELEFFANYTLELKENIKKKNVYNSALENFKINKPSKKELTLIGIFLESLKDYLGNVPILGPVLSVLKEYFEASKEL